MVRQGWEVFIPPSAMQHEVLENHELRSSTSDCLASVLGGFRSVLFPILLLSCTSSATEVKNVFPPTSTGPSSGSQRVHVSHFQARLPQLRRGVSEGSWHARPAAFLLSSQPHGQGLHALSAGHRLAGCVLPSRLPALATCPCAASALTGVAVADASGGPPRARRPPPSHHAHTDTPMSMQSHVHFLALFQQAENKNNNN